jgi:plastocyanin
MTTSCGFRFGALPTLIGAHLLAGALVLTTLAVRAGPAAVPLRPGATATPAAERGLVEHIAIANFAFSPATLTVPVGAALTWTNEDDAPHMVTGVDGDSPINSQPLDTGDSYTLVMERTGTYKYFCKLHPMMVGTIVVQQPNADVQDGQWSVRF